MMNNPQVSICIPTFNRAELIGMAIESALQQSYVNIEIIVVDNDSTDNTKDVVMSYNDPRLKYVKNEKNLGLFGNFNRCIDLAKGKYIHILHSDDYIDANFTKNCVGFLESHPHVAMTFSSVVVLSGSDQKKISLLDHNHIFTAPEGFRQILRTRNLINCPTVVIRREIYDVAGQYSCEYPYSADLYQWLKISRRFDIAYITHAVLYYRQGKHTESYQHLFKGPSGYLDTIKIYIRIMDELGETSADYFNDLNTAIRRHMKDCLYAGITRYDFMSHYSPLVFFGFAVNAWGLIRPTSFPDRIIKLFELLEILTVGCIIVFPTGRFCLKKIVGTNNEIY
jgi:glycosyltransferase involved in cell wall biosynthesis